MMKGSNDEESQLHTSEPEIMAQDMEASSRIGKDITLPACE